jgi:hypothetical protein
MAGEQNIAQQPPSKVKALYDAVSKDYDIGSYDDFNKKLQDPSKRQAFYNGVGKQYDLGSYEQFEEKVGGVKKKDNSNSSPNSPSDTLPTQTKPEQPVNTSVSESDFKDHITGELPKDEKEYAERVNSFVKNPNITQTSGDKDTILEQAAQRAGNKYYVTAEGKAQLEKKKKDFQQHFKDHKLTAEDMSLFTEGAPDIKDWNGLDLEQMADAINNKSKNLDQWQNAPTQKDVQNTVNQLNEIRKNKDEIEQKRTMSSGARFGIDISDSEKQQLSNLEQQEIYAKSSIQKAYNREKDKIVPDIVDGIKGQLFGNSDWTSVYENPNAHLNETDLQKAIDQSVSPTGRKSPLQWNPETHRLTPESDKWIRGYVDKELNAKKNNIINAQVSGDINDKNRTYQDVSDDVVRYLNTVVPVQAAQKKYTDDFVAKNPKLKDVLSAQEEQAKYFSKENSDAAISYAHTWRDKEYMKAQQKYFSNNGILNKNQDYEAISHKYAQLVHDGKMTEEIAKKQIDAELKQHPSLKSIVDNYQNDVKSVNDKTSQIYENYLINGLKKVDPKLTAYKNGDIGIQGMTQDEYSGLIKKYQGGLDKVRDTLLDDQQKAYMDEANKKAKGHSFMRSLGSSIGGLQSGVSKFIFNKTGWGGDKVRYFESQEMSSPQATQSDEAKRWNWKGVESLTNPDFWLSGVANNVPVLAGGAAISAATDGSGLPAYVGWLANAGLFTAQSGISTYNNLLSSTDTYGNRLTEADASHYMAKDMKDNFVPNLLMTALTSGALSRVKNIAKPSIAATVGKGVLSGAEAQPFFTWQGYNSYANMLQAQGKKADFWDYMQSDDFKDNLVNGMVVGGGLGLLHTPGTYLKQIKNWTNLIHSSEGEFRANSLYNVAMQHEMNGSGNYFRDAAKLHIFNESYGSPAEKADLENVMQYSVALDRNLRGANLDSKNVNDLYQAHNLALADLHDELSEKNAANKNLAKIYTDKAKEYRDQAKSVSDGTAKYHYLKDDMGNPIFLSDNSFKALDKSGKIAEWMKAGTIEDVVSTDDPEFGKKYKESALKEEVQAKTPSKPDITPEEQGSIIKTLQDNKEDLKGQLGAGVKSLIDDPGNHKDIVEGIISQGIDNPEVLKGMVGDEAYKVLEPIINKYKDNASEVRENKGELQEVGKTDEGVQKNSSGNLQQTEETGTKTSDKEQQIAPEDQMPVSEMLGKSGLYKGQRGSFEQDGQSVIFKVKDSNREYELGNVNEIGGRSVKDFGIEPEESVVKPLPSGNLEVRGKEYINKYSDPLAAINYDKDGNIVSINLETPEGQKRTFRGNVAEDLAYQLHLKQISDNNEQPELEQFINSDEQSRNEIENGRPSETTQEGAAKNNEPVQREKIEPAQISISSPKIENDEKEQQSSGKKGSTESKPESQKQQTPPNDEKGSTDNVVPPEGAESGKKPAKSAPSNNESPPPPVVGPSEEGLHPKDNEWTSIQKKDLSERVQKENAFTQTNKETVNNVINRVTRDATANGRTWQSQIEFEVNALHGSFFNDDGSIRQAFNPTTDQLALIGMRLMDINGESSVSEFNPNDDQQTARNAYLENEKMKAERLLSFGEAGRAFQFRQSLLKMGINGDIQIKRKAISSLVGMKIPETEQEFHELSDFDKKKIKPVYDAFQKWKGQYEEENKSRSAIDEKYSKEEFDKRIKQEVSEAIKGKNISEKENKSTKEKSKKISDSLKSFADKFEKFGRADLPEGTKKSSFGPDIQKKIADAIRYIAEKIANGDLKIPELILEAIERFKDKDLSESDLSENIKKGLSEAGLDENALNAPTNREKILVKMKEIAKNSGVNGITKEMTDKGLVRDYLHDIARRGVSSPEGILNRGVKELREAFPEINEKTLRDAYLKEGAFKPDKSNDLESQIKKSAQSFHDITVLQRDIEALETGSKLYGADKEKRNTIISDYEKGLRDEKDKLIKEKNRAERDNKDKNKKDNKLAEYDKRIKELDDHQKLWDRIKTSNQVDKDLADKKEELRKALIRNGVKLETGSKDARQTKEKVIEAHNDRISHLKDKIANLLNDDTVSEEDKKSLRSVKASLDNMNVKIDAGELSEKIRKAMASAGKIHADNITNLLTGIKSGILKDLKDLGTQLKKDNNSALQDIQLAQLKRSEISRKEQAERQLASGNFEDAPKLSDYKKDEELLKLSRDRKLAESNLTKEVDRYKKQNQSFWQRQAERLKRIQRANLISGIMTNGKVLVATVVKPVSDALVRRTIGTLTSPIFKSIGLKGEREALNNDATIKSFVDSFKGMTQKKAAEIRGTSEKSLENATINLQAANDQLKALESQYGKDKPEYQKYKDNEYTKSVNDFQSAQYDWAASMMYDFISPRAWAERLNILKSGTSTFEESMGGYKGQTWADEKSVHAIGTIANKLIHTLEIFARVHGAEKDISARQAFVEGFLKRASERIKAGEQLTPSKLEGIALQSYPDFLGGKFQNKNPASEFIRKTQIELDKKGPVGKVVSFGIGATTPVLKVPLNIEAEGLFKYTAGLPVAIYKTFNEIGKALKANDLTIKDGIKDFNNTMQVVKDHMEQLPPEKRDEIIRYANKGIFGAAMALVTGSLVASGSLVFGGAYGKGQKKRKYLDADTGEMEELNYGEIALNGHKLGKFWSAVVLHLPPLMPAVMSAAYVQKYKDERGDEDNPKGASSAAWDGLSEVVRTAWEESALKSLGDIAEAPSNIFNSFTTQMAAKNITEFFDTDANGNLVERKAENTWDKILLRTGGRRLVPTKDQYESDQDQKGQDNYEKATQQKEGDLYYQKNQK